MKMETLIPRNTHGLACTTHCREAPDGGVELIVGDVHYELGHEDIADAHAFAQTFWRLREKRWFTSEVNAELTAIVTARWLSRVQVAPPSSNFALRHPTA